MKISEIPSEDLEGQLLAHIERHARLCVPGHQSHDDALWMREAVEELRLRRLARSAG